MAENSGFRVDRLGSIDARTGGIRFQPVESRIEQCRAGWLPAGTVTVGITAGASTPNNKIGETIERIAAMRGLQLDGAL